MNANRIFVSIVVMVFGVFVFTGCSKKTPASPGTGGGGGGGASARVVGNVDMPDDASGVYAGANHVYVSASGAGLQVVDISDKTMPGIVAGLPTIYASGGVEATASGDFLYVSAGVTGFHLVDISTPLAPTNFATVNTPATANDVALTSTASAVLCVADGASGVQFYFSTSGTSSLDTPELATGIAATDVYCFVTDLPDGIGTPAPAMHVIDVSNPYSPNLVRTLPLGGSPSGIAIAGNFAYVAAGDPGMYVIDISNPLAPAVAGQTIPLSTTGPIAADLARNVVYLGTTDTAGFPKDGLKIVDVSTPASPTVVETVNLPHWTTGVTFRGDYVYVVTDDFLGGAVSTLQIIDVSDF